MSLVEESHTNPVNNLDNNKARKTEKSVESRCLERIFDTKRRRCLFYDGPRRWTALAADWLERAHRPDRGKLGKCLFYGGLYAVHSI